MNKEKEIRNYIEFFKMLKQKANDKNNTQRFLNLEMMEKYEIKKIIKKYASEKN